MLEDFEFVFKKMDVSFEVVEQMMRVIYEKIKDDPTDEYSISLLEGLVEVASRIVYSQRDFTDVYCDSEVKSYFSDKVDDKINYLSGITSQIVSGRSR